MKRIRITADVTGKLDIDLEISDEHYDEIMSELPKKNGEAAITDLLFMNYINHEDCGDLTLEYIDVENYDDFPG